MGKKLFVLLVLTMILATITVLTFTLTGHDDLVAAAFAWLANSTTSIVETLGFVGVFVLVLLVCGD